MVEAAPPPFTLTKNSAVVDEVKLKRRHVWIKFQISSNQLNLAPLLNELMNKNFLHISTQP